MPRLLWNPEPATGPCSEPHESSPHHHIIYFSHILILFHLRLGLPCDYSLQIFRLQFCVFFINPMRATWPVKFTLLDLMALIICGEAYRSWGCSLCSVLRPYCTSSHLRTLFSNPSLNSCLTLKRDQVSHPCKTTGKWMQRIESGESYIKANTWSESVKQNRNLQVWKGRQM